MTKGAWISVDGVEAAGKTTLVHALHAQISNSEVVAEFLDDPVGRFLRGAVVDTPHIFSSSRVGQSLIFLGEFWQRFAARILPILDAGGVVLSDRGYLSKYVYQLVVMRPEIGSMAARRLLDAVFATMPAPDLSLVLCADGSEIRDRLLRRDGHCNDERIAFIREAQVEFESTRVDAGHVVLLRTDVAGPAETYAQAQSIVRQHLGRLC